MHRLLHRHWYHSWNRIKGGGFQKLSHCGRGKGGGGWGTKFYARKEDKTEKEELMQKWRGCQIFITLQFNCIYCVWVKSKVFFITFWFFSLWSWPCKILIQVFIVLKHCIICIFLIHSDSFWSILRMSTTLLNLVWNTQKGICTTFFKYQGKMFLNIEIVLVS